MKLINLKILRKYFTYINDIIFVSLKEEKDPYFKEFLTELKKRTENEIKNIDAVYHFSTPKKEK